jgi:hypothetical protein
MYCVFEIASLRSQCRNERVRSAQQRKNEFFEVAICVAQSEVLSARREVI